MKFSIKQLRVFSVIAETSSFRAAAETVYLTPAAVSILIRDLELELGFLLFSRDSRSVALTRQGRQFLPAARRLLDEFQATELTAREVKAEAVGIVRIAAPLVVASVILPKIIVEFEGNFPGYLVRLIDVPVQDMVGYVERDACDFAIGADRPTNGLVKRLRLSDAPWMVWCSSQNFLSTKSEVEWEELANHPIIALGSDLESHMRATPEIQKFFKSFAPKLVVANVTSALGLSAVGYGVTIAPQYVKTMADHFRLVGIPIRSPVIKREMSIFYSATRSLNAACLEFKSWMLRGALEGVTREYPDNPSDACKV